MSAAAALVLPPRAPPEPPSQAVTVLTRRISHEHMAHENEAGSALRALPDLSPSPTYLHRTSVLHAPR